MSGGRRSVYLIVTAAPPALEIARLVERLHDDGWRVSVIATPTAASWMDLDGLADETGVLVGRESGFSGRESALPRADAVLVAPATFNTINKWAQGISDNLALGLLNELLAADVPMLVVPCVKQLLRRHPAYATSVTTLTNEQVLFMDPDEVTTRSPDGFATFHWHLISSAFERLNTRG